MIIRIAAVKYQPVSDRLLANLFLDALQEQSDLFYKSYYTDSPIVASA